VNGSPVAFVTDSHSTPASARANRANWPVTFSSTTITRSIPAAHRRMRSIGSGASTRG
jgi:hypothetical protein